MKKKLLIGFGIYLILLIGVSVFFLLKGEQNYFSYKSYLKTIEENSTSKPVITPGTGNTNSPGTSSSGLDNKNNNPPGNTGNTGNENSGTPSTTPNTPASPDTGNESTPGKTPQVENEQETYANISFTRNLRKGAKGEDVKKLQYLLKQNKLYDGNIDGIFGTVTYKAVIDFQTNNKISADGIAGPNTFRELLK